MDSTRAKIPPAKLRTNHWSFFQSVYSTRSCIHHHCAFSSACPLILCHHFHAWTPTFKRHKMSIYTYTYIYTVYITMFVFSGSSQTLWAPTSVGQYCPIFAQLTHRVFCFPSLLWKSTSVPREDLSIDCIQLHSKVLLKRSWGCGNFLFHCIKALLQPYCRETCISYVLSVRPHLLSLAFDFSSVESRPLLWRVQYDDTEGCKRVKSEDSEERTNVKTH